jgi:hypothetical protein
LPSSMVRSATASDSFPWFSPSEHLTPGEGRGSDGGRQGQPAQAPGRDHDPSGLPARAARRRGLRPALGPSGLFRYSAPRHANAGIWPLQRLAAARSKTIIAGLEKSSALRRRQGVPMSWRSAVSFALPCFAALVCWASFASATPCLPSATAVRQDYPGAWPSWTLRAEGHEGVKCWYPATRPPAADHKTPSEVQAAAENASVTVEAAPTRPSPITAAETHGVGSGPQNEAANSGSISALEESLFVDRFAAVYAHNSFGDWSLRRYLVELAMTMSEARN